MLTIPLPSTAPQPRLVPSARSPLALDFHLQQGEIKATGFNEACDNLEPLFQEGKVYYISKARVNIAKKQFSNLSSEYEIMFEKDTEVQLVSGA